MTREERKLQKHVEEHEKNLNRKSHKLAAKMRQAARAASPRPRLDLRAVDWEELEDEPITVIEKRGRPRKEAPARSGQVIASHTQLPGTFDLVVYL